MALTALEDTYLTILEIDGPEWTDRLRKRMDGKRFSGNGVLETDPLIV